MATGMGDFTEILLRKEIVSPEQLDEAAEMARETDMNLSAALIRLGYASGDEVMAAATSHTARQSMLNSRPSSVSNASNFAPLGFVAKIMPLRWSWNGSRAMAMASSPRNSGAP